MKTIFETCTPRDEVLKGELREQQFAASLTRVLRGDPDLDPVYGDSATFFANTYPTEGLKSLLDESLGRLTGRKPASAPVIRLETSFGGGKTHNLIALYHLCGGKVHPKDVKTFVAPELVPTKKIEKVAGIVGPDMNPAEGIDHGDVRTYTLWGEIAYQLGRKKGYELIRKNDEQRSPPGAIDWANLIGDDPALIMIDEVAAYLRAAKATPSPAGDTTLADQTVAFLMSLMKSVSESKRAVLVYTLTEASDAFGKESEELHQALAEARSVSARQEHVLTPTKGETEISAIVSHRLFSRVDRSTAEATANAYAASYRQQVERGVDLPSRATRSEYRDEMIADYPFHPELLTTLNRKTSTIPNFQKTRGVLRLLALVIRDLWAAKPKDCCLVCPHHLNLGLEAIANDLTSRLDRPQFKQVIQADIASPGLGTPSHAQEVDTEWTAAGKPSYARRLATTIFVHSLVQTGQSGVDPADLRLAVLQPDDDSALIDKATQRLLDHSWFLDYDGLRYRFKTEPSLRKIVDDEMGLVGKVKAKNELDERIRKVWKKGVFEPMFFPTEAGDVDDNPGPPKLVVIHYDAAAQKAAEAHQPPDLVAKIFEHKGTLQEYRTYKNNLVFLVADADQVDRMVEVAQRYLAVHRIVGDPDRLREFNKEQAGKLKKMAEAAELDLRVAITKAYRHFYFPSADAPRKAANLAYVGLQPGDQGEVEKDQTEVVLRVLKSQEKVLTADEDKPLSAQYLKAKAWPANTTSMTTEELRRAFAQRLALKMLLDVNQLKRTIKDGAAKGIWIYYPADEQVGYGPPSPVPLVQISEDAALYTPEEATRLGIKIKGAEPVTRICPVCGKDPCVCGKEQEDKDKQPPRFSTEGTPAQALQALADRCHDQGVKGLKRLSVRIEGMGKDAARDTRLLGLAVPQIGKALFNLEQKMVLEFSTGEKFSVEFAGTWDRYKRLKTVTDAFSQEATNASVRVALHADFETPLEVAGDQFGTIRDVLNNLGMGRIIVDAEPAGEEKK